MSLEQWFRNNWLKQHRTSRDEIASLLAIVERDLQDARASDISTDWRFGIAYNAPLKLCTILLYAEGYRPEKTLQHYRTLQALPLIWGPARKPDAEYLDTCRAKRNTLEYDYVGGVSDADADELIAFVQDLKQAVLTWLKKSHPDFVP